MRKLFLTVLGIVSAVSAVHGQITYNDIDDYVFTPPNPDLFLNIVTGDLTTVSSEPDLAVGFGFAFGNPESLFFSGNGNSPAWHLARTSDSKARRFSFGDTLDFSQTATVWMEADNVSNNSTWSGSEAGQTYYLGLHNPTQSLDAWVALEYDDLGNKLTIQSFAVAPSSQNMTAGQTPVPEPAETASVMALLAAGAAIWRKRRKKVAA